MKPIQSHTSMKKFLPFLAALFLATVSWGQTGNGVLLLSDAEFTFTPTTVDSSMTLELTGKNDLSIPQAIYLGGLDAPYALSSDSVYVEGDSTFQFSITFTPSAVGSFADTLELTGDVFGEASLALSGDGIQVQLEWTPDTLAFDTTAIGQTNSQTLALSSVGDGAAVISSIEFSNDVFSVASQSLAPAPIYYSISNGDWPSEIFWELRMGEELIASGGAGEFGQWQLSPGDYTFYGFDAYGDGWNGAVAQLINECTGETLISFEVEEGSESTASFNVSSSSWPVLLEIPGNNPNPNPSRLRSRECRTRGRSHDAPHQRPHQRNHRNRPHGSRHHYEVSGDCDITWTLINSPYNLVGDVMIPEDPSTLIQASRLLAMTMI